MRQRTHPAYLPPLAAAATGVLVGASLVATRSVIEVAGPTSLAFLRYSIGIACLLPLTLVAARWRIAGRDLLPIALLGVGQFGILVVLLNWSLQSIGSGRAALLFSTMPLMTMAFATVLRREAFSSATLIGVLAAIAGVAVVVGQDGMTGSGRDFMGEGAALASALTGAVCSVLYRPYLLRYTTLPVSAYAMAAAVAFLAAPAAADGLVVQLAGFDARDWLTIAFIGISSAVGYLCWLWALGHASPTRVTIFLALSPVTAIVGGQIILAEPITPRLVAGIGLVSLGMWLAHLRAREPRA